VYHMCWYVAWAPTPFKGLDRVGVFIEPHPIIVVRGKTACFVCDVLDLSGAHWTVYLDPPCQLVVGI
jgi:hypothetical protein